MPVTRLAMIHQTDHAGRVPRNTFALVVLCLAQFGIVLAYQGTTISLPEVERSFDLSVSTSQWLVSANALAYGGLLLPAGRAADLLGHRRLFLAGSAIFGGASLAAGLAPTVEWLIAARALQGVGTALFTPAMIALLADTFPEGAARSRALAFWGAAGPLGGVGAILLGGALASALGWRAVFLLGAPITLVVVLLAKAVLPAVHTRPRGRLDPFAALAGTMGIGVLVYGLGNLSDSTLFTVRSSAWLVIGLVLLGVFVRLERRSASPLVPRSLRGRVNTWRPIGVAFFHGASTNTPIVFYSLFMQRYRAATPWDIGLGFLPCNLAIMVASAAGARLARRVGYRLVMAGGMAIVIAGLLTLTTISADRSYLVTFLPAWTLVGLGLGAAQVGIIGAATAQATPEERGVIGGLVNTAVQMGTAVGLAVLVTISHWPMGEIEGYRAAFVGAGALALLGLIGALAPTKWR
jgi:MFS family permease